MKRKLKIQFYKANKALVFQVLEQKGLPTHKVTGHIHMEYAPQISQYYLYLRGENYGADDCVSILNLRYEKNPETAQRELIDRYVNAITEELFTVSDLDFNKGDIVYDPVNKCTCTLLDVLPDNYENRYVCAIDNTAYIAEDIEPVGTVNFKADKSNYIETYTWEV